MPAYNIVNPLVIIEGGPYVGAWLQAPPVGATEWCAHHQRLEQITTAKCTPEIDNGTPPS